MEGSGCVTVGSGVLRNACSLRITSQYFSREKFKLGHFLIAKGLMPAWSLSSSTMRFALFN
jgi:hypothetical protein